MTDVNIAVTIESPGAVPPGGDPTKLLSADSHGKPVWVAGTGLEGLPAEVARAEAAEAAVLAEAEAYVNSKLSSSTDISVVDNLNGTVTLIAFNPATVADNGDGIVSVSGVTSLAVLDNNDGTLSLLPFGAAFATIANDIATAKSAAEAYTDQQLGALSIVDNLDGTVSISL